MWGENLKSFKEQVRNQTSRRQEKSGIQTLGLEKNPLRERLDNIISFRLHHHKLKQIIQKTLNKDSHNSLSLGREDGTGRNFEEQALTDINEAYSLFLSINVLDVNKEGSELWDMTKKSYDNKIDKVES